jgi:hypothetical protein
MVFRNISIALVLIATTSFAFEAKEVSTTGFLSSAQTDEQVSSSLLGESAYLRCTPRVLLDAGRELRPIQSKIVN